MAYKPQEIKVGIDPAGIGTTGICVKSWNTYYPKTYYTSIQANSSVEAANKIIEYIKTIKNSFFDDVELKEVIVEVPHKGIEKWTEIKATRELVGILKFVYKDKFKGHQPNHKDKTLKESIKQSKKSLSDHEIDAEVIMHAHFKEEALKFTCENYLGREKTHE